MMEQVTQADREAAASLTGEEAMAYGMADLSNAVQAFAAHRRTNDQAKDEEIARLREALADIPGVAKAAAYGCGLDSRLAGIIADTVEKITSHVLAENRCG